jgi:hypothetical protein
MGAVRPLPPPGAAHPLGGTVYSRSEARRIILGRWQARRPNDPEDFIRQTFGVRWDGDQTRDAQILDWIEDGRPETPPPVHIDPDECPF